MTNYGILIERAIAALKGAVIAAEAKQERATAWRLMTEVINARTSRAVADIEAKRGLAETARSPHPSDVVF
jgi:hypothetical protein